MIINDKQKNSSPSRAEKRTYDTSLVSSETSISRIKKRKIIILGKMGVGIGKI